MSTYKTETKGGLLFSLIPALEHIWRFIQGIFHSNYFAVLTDLFVTAANTAVCATVGFVCTHYLKRFFAKREQK